MPAVAPWMAALGNLGSLALASSSGDGRGSDWRKKSGRRSTDNSGVLPLLHFVAASPEMAASARAAAKVALQQLEKHLATPPPGWHGEGRG